MLLVSNTEHIASAFYNNKKAEMKLLGGNKFVKRKINVYDDDDGIPLEGCCESGGIGCRPAVVMRRNRFIISKYLLKLQQIRWDFSSCCKL